MLKEKKLKNGTTVLTGVTPKGEAQYPHVFEPQTKIGDQPIDPTYSVTLYFKAEEPAVETLMTQLKEQLHRAEEKAIEQTSKVKGRKAKLPTCHDENFGNEIDQDGNETGRVYIKAKAKAGGTTQTGKQWTFKPPVFDATNTPFPEKDPPLIGNNSTCRAAVTVIPYAAAIGYGVSIRLEALQVIHLIEYNGKSGTAYGFETEPDGYKQSKEDTTNRETFAEETEETDTTHSEKETGDF